ncbi:MAG TPA: EamA family transporter [Pyrinomonadaceae bacterium]|nr:EamA family transporter [Pyrinomonadaceae bacterium]
MTSFYLPFAVTVGGMLFYHISQKAIPKEMNPFLVTILAYAVGILFCAICAWAYPGKRSLTESLKETNWAVLTLGLAAAAIELGFMLAYRAGWRISVAAVVTNVAVTVLLIPIGIIFFRDHLSLRNIVGVVFCVLGLAMVARE